MDLLKRGIDNGSIMVHDEFLKDVQDLLKKELHGQEKRFYTHLRKQLSYINDYPPEEIWKVDGNEKIKKCKEFSCYSLHLQGAGFNIRFLITYKRKQCILLVAFNEIGKKKSSGYDKYIKIAIKRLKEISEDK